jgi:hypothetical protein
VTAPDDKKQAEFAQIYARLLDEARNRLNSIPTIRRELGPWVPTYVTDESAYVQLRMVCELIAIGCLVAHGDIPVTRVGKLLSAKYPTVIMLEMEKLHPDFYPIPFDQDGEIFTELKTGFLTKPDLLALYDECGNALHRGTLKKVIRGHTKLPQFERVMKWVNLTTRLIFRHNIRLAQPDRLLQFNVGSKNTTWGVFKGNHVKAISSSQRPRAVREASRLQQIRRPR